MLKVNINIHPLIFILTIFLFCLASWAQEKLPPIRPYKTDTPPVIDGKLDETVWQKAPQVSGFKTWVPDYGKDMTEKTEVYCAYDRENFYVAFRSFDSEPDKIKSSVTSRDNINPDDWVCVNLDSFNDQQSLYTIYCNPMGVQGDAKAEGNQEDFNVDIVWYSEGEINQQGYTVEMRIPFKSIRFSRNEPVEMGVIFERKISRLTELGTYPPLDPEQGPNFFTQTVTLLFEDIKHYTLFEAIPAATFSQRSELEEGRLKSDKGVGDLSLTAKYGITSRLIFDGTINPDFSQVEADAGQVDFNLRYALFFPEKRPFFLEGLEKFHFGGNHSGDPLQAVVHTRTIVEPLLGAKLTGKIGAKNTVATIYAMDKLPDDDPVDYAHVGIFRYKRTLDNDSFIGGFYTGRERENGHNRVFGLDGQMRINKSSILGYHGFLSSSKQDTHSSQEDGHALGLHYFYTTRNWIIMLGLQDLAEDFHTETGYVTRTGITRFRSGIMRMFYPQSGIIKRFEPLIHSSQIYDKPSGLYETNNALDMRFLLPRSTMILFGYRYSTEVWQKERFSTNRARFIGSSQITNKLHISLNYFYGNKIRYVENPYQGKGNDVIASLTFLPLGKLHLELSLLYSDFTRKSDSKKEIDYTIIRSKNTFQVNKYLFFRAIVEYNSFRKQMITDFLASFTYIPGTVIHIGYGSLYEKIRWEEGDYRPSDNFLETRRGFFFKASYLWRL
ncbi:MAG: carbohydrate binding family 9 domain-containing protein [Candidatus Aminicenantes bacterium]|nr:MAG: carbohydrate binding family 9 domain-containing protein [Candidatus Aminicenantes bacterium]